MKKKSIGVLRGENSKETKEDGRTWGWERIEEKGKKKDRYVSKEQERRGKEERK